MNKPVINVDDVLSMLQNGKTRADIAEHYGISGVDCKALFQHPRLKHKKTIKPKELGFILVDDQQQNSPGPELVEQAVTPEEDTHTTPRTTWENA